MSAAKLSKETFKAYKDLPRESQEGIAKVYQRTLTMVTLHHLGLMKPSPDSVCHLLDFQHVIRQEQARITNPS